jgi:4a-hydroxytetrahydrobiopterin dehydratase
LLNNRLLEEPFNRNPAMTTATQLAQQHCKPCEGGVEPMEEREIAEQLRELSGWRLDGDKKRIRKEWVAKDFSTAIDFFHQVATIANAEDHHPDLHLTGYRNVAIELSTHAIGGLSENDFILAAKIDRLPIELKKPK